MRKNGGIFGIKIKKIQLVINCGIYYLERRGE
jgi:hypothetical protein